MGNAHIELICIGTELLTGKVNTHAAYLGQKLFEVGLSLAYEHTVADDEKKMIALFKEAWRRSDIVFAAGGLGPTFDDITRECWSRVLNRPLEKKNWIVTDIKKKFQRRGLAMPPQNIRQADVIRGAKVIPNRVGTAPGQIFTKGQKTLILLPGPASELYPMVESFVVPQLKKKFHHQYSQQKTFLIFGIAESKIDDLIRPTIELYSKVNQCAVTYGILASQAIVSVKFRVEGTKRASVKKATNFLTKKFRSILTPYVFGEDNQTIPSLVGVELKRKKQTLSIAESCTGGLLSKMVTDISGSSKYFLQGLITYTNESKQRQLGIKNSLLKKYGAVSNEVAHQMATFMRARSRSDYALSVTGIAGPTGGTKEKPVGLVYIGCATPTKTIVQKFLFKGDRSTIRQRAALTALHLIIKQLQA